MLCNIIELHGPLQFATTGFKMEILFGSFSNIYTSCPGPTCLLCLNLCFATGWDIICYHYVQSLVRCISEQKSSLGRKCDFKNVKMFEVPWLPLLLDLMMCCTGNAQKNILSLLCLWSAWHKEHWLAIISQFCWPVNIHLWGRQHATDVLMYARYFWPTNSDSSTPFLSHTLLLKYSLCRSQRVGFISCRSDDLSTGRMLWPWYFLTQLCDLKATEMAVWVWKLPAELLTDHQGLWAVKVFC